MTVVSGVPRSGTSLGMQMLAAGGLPVLRDDARPPDADNPRGYYEYEPVKRLAACSSWIAGARGRAVKVIHLLVPKLPSAIAYRVVLMRRPLAEVIASQDAMLARRGGAPEDALPAGRLAEVYEAQLGELRAWVGAARERALLELDFHALLADPGAGAAALDDFLGGGLDRAAMAAAVDPALRRQRL